MAKSTFITNAISIVIFAGLPVRVYAINTPPSFPTCLNPQGTIRASYDNGQHGIAGKYQIYHGADVVYQLSDYGSMQCFCEPDGQGVQTNWWKADILDSKQIMSYVSQGWIYEPQGIYWGLDNAPYLAQNSSYACRAQQTALVAGTNEKNITDSGSNQSIPSSTVSAHSLAFTGNSLELILVLLTGITLLLVGFFLRKQK